MSIWKNLSVAVAAISLSAGVALAQGAPSLSMVSTFELDPSKIQQFDDAWSDIQEIAEANDYAYTEFVGGSRNERWIVTPIKSYADLDAVFEARGAVSEAGGKKFAKALASFENAMMTSHSWISRSDADLSYAPEGGSAGSFMEIDTHQYRYGTDEEMKAILGEWKALMTAKGSPQGYQVSWDQLGAPGNSVTIISYAEDAVAMAQENAAVNALIDGDDKAEALIERFLKISTGSETVQTSFNPGASMNVPAQE